jgi:hypothetical protein
MARAKNPGNGRLEVAMAILLQTPAAFVARISETDQRRTELERENSERFARIERMLLEHNRILADYNEILKALPDALREKIGFKVPGQPGRRCRWPRFAAASRRLEE